MINASKDFKEKLKTGGTVVNYADVTLSDGTVLHLEPKDIMVGGCTIEDKTTDGKFGVGFVIGKTLNLRVANHDDQYSIYDFYNSAITLYVAVQLDDGTIEKIRKGVYCTTVPETPGEIIEISAVDSMYKLDRDYAGSTLAYPASLQQIISGACLDCGIPIGFTQFDNMSFVVQEKPEKATYREIVSYACQIAGYNARIDNNGYMQLVWYNTDLMDRKLYDGGDFKQYPHDKVLDGGTFTNYATGKIISGGTFTDVEAEHIFRFKNLSVGTDDVEITGVRVANDETEGFFGETGYVITVENNPFTVDKEQEVANYLGGRMVGLSFRPFSGDVLGNPLYEPFDVCRISDRKGRMYRSVINSVSYTVGSYTQIACEAEDPVRRGSVYSSPAAAAVVEARRNAQKQITEYDKAVQNMNQIAMNAMGFHTTFEDQPDGSRITYLHDKPNLSDSTIVYKQTIDGFFVSQDGGKSYTSGFDSQGNAVVNILYAIGIVADWIRTGHLSADRINGGTLIMGGNGNTNGRIIILDANGKQIGIWDNNGLTTTKGSFSGHVTAYSLTLGSDASISADSVDGLSGVATSGNYGDLSGKPNLSAVATSGNYNDLSNKPTIPTVPDNIITEDEVSVTTSTDANGVVTKTIRVGDETYTVKYSDNYVITNVGIGTQNTDKTSSYFKISREGLLEANNALIYGTVYARNGEFSGELKGATGSFAGDVNARNLILKNTLYMWITGWGETRKGEIIRIEESDEGTTHNRFCDLYIGMKGSFEPDPYSEIFFGLDKIYIENPLYLEDYLVAPELYNQLSFAGLSKRALYVGSDGKVSAASSSRRYKQDISQILDDYFNPEGLYKIPVCQARYKKEYGGGDDSPLYITLIAEDVAKYFPAAARWNKDHTEVDTWEMSDMFPAALKLIQDQHKEIEDLKFRVAKLEKMMEELYGNRN